MPLNANASNVLVPPVPGMPDKPPTEATKIVDIMKSFNQGGSTCSMAGWPSWRPEDLQRFAEHFFRLADLGFNERTTGSLDEPYDEDLDDLLEDEADC